MKSMSRIFSIIILALIHSNSFGQKSQICIAKYSEDSLRVSVHDLIKDPIIGICGIGDHLILSYALSLNINGVLYQWKNLTNPKLDKEKIELLREVQDDMPKYNALIIENVHYTVDTDTIVQNPGFFLWLAQHSNCNGKYDIKKERFENEWQIKFEYFVCEGMVFLTKEYDEKGNLIKTRTDKYVWKE